MSRSSTKCVELHRNQARKGTAIPYVTHLFAVCSLVLEDGGTEDEAIAALLHDGPEDQGGEPVLAEIRRRFGDEVAGMVEGLSDSMTSGDEEKEAWRPRKERYLERLETEPESVLRISLADKLHNARSMAVDWPRGETLWDRFHAGKEDQAWYFGRAPRIFEERIPESRNLPAFRLVVCGDADSVRRSNGAADVLETSRMPPEREGSRQAQRVRGRPDGIRGPWSHVT